ncbi:putative cation-transporting ATPase 13A4 [Lissotriton helveticus]
MSYVFSAQKKARLKIKEINQRLIRTKEELARNLRENVPIEEHLLKIMALRAEAAESISKKAAENYLTKREAVYELSEKVGHLLAVRTRQRLAASDIAEIMDGNGAMVIETVKVREVFRHFYEELYTKDRTGIVSEVENYLSDITPSAISREEKLRLDSPFSLEEFIIALSTLPSGKAAGPDQLPVEFYKVFHQAIGMDMFNVMLEAQKGVMIPASWGEADIIVILKKGKIATLAGSYSPITLMNADTKVYSKILARRLAKVIEGLVSHTQHGFIPGKSTTQHIRQVVTTFDAADVLGDPIAALFLDAEKAFDRVSWEYLWQTLKWYDQDTEEMEAAFSRWLLQAADVYAPCTNFPRSRPNDAHMWFSPLLKSLKLGVRQMERKWRTDYLEADRVNYCKTRKDYQKLLQEHKTNYFSKKILNAHNKSKELFNIVENLSASDRTSLPIAPTQELCNSLNSFFSDKISAIKQSIPTTQSPLLLTDNFHNTATLSSLPPVDSIMLLNLLAKVTSGSPDDICPPFILREVGASIPEVKVYTSAVNGPQCHVCLSNSPDFSETHSKPQLRDRAAETTSPNMLSVVDIKPRLAEDHTHGMELFGFRAQTCRVILCLLGYLFSLGFLKLLFHWKPEWDVWAHCTPCTLEDADVILLRTTDAFQQYSKKKVTWISVYEPTYMCTRKQGPLISMDESSLVNRVIMKPLLKVRCIQVQKIRYAWDSSEKQFQKIGVLEDKYSCSEIHSKFGSGFTIEEHILREKICGPNTIEVDILPIWKLLFKEVLNPFYWFQAASISLWVAYTYYEYSFAIMTLTIISISVTVHDLRKQSINLHKLVEVHNSVIVTVCQKDGDCKEVESRHLVPGDVILLPGNKLYLPCDAILINGSCIVNEGTLTGESVPVKKIPLPNINNSVPWKIHSKEDYKKHILFCGTELIQSKPSRMEPAKAVVLQTGFNTAKGDLVRSILYTKPVDAKLYRDAVRFILGLLFLSLIGFTYSAIVLKSNGVSVGDIVVHGLFLVTSMVPPSLPAALAVGTMYAQKRLKKSGIFCISPKKITVLGWFNLVCFDKTGTLTEEGLDLWGLIPSKGQSFQTVHRFTQVDSLPWSPLLAALASCHSLIFLDGKLQGDPLDLTMFEGTNWTIENCSPDKHKEDQSSSMVIKPGPRAGKVPVDGVVVMQQFPFSSSLQRMSVVTQVIGSNELMGFMKGAPEMVVRFCRPQTVPLNLLSELEHYTLQGFRVIGLAYKTLATKTDVGVETFTREEVESDLEFLGLLVMGNKVKAETKPALRELMDAQIRAVMITGDNLQTALTVAKHSGMVPKRSEVIVVEANGPKGSIPATLIFQTQKDNVRNGQDIFIKMDENPVLKYAANEFYFAMSGNSYQVIVQHFYHMLPKLLLNGVVFARMSPQQKTSLIEEFRKLDYYVGMCGDGANDCGALKMAHAGISLSEQEASVASPFTSKTPNIQCVPKLIKEGRCALDSSFCVIKYIITTNLMACNCALLLYWENRLFGNYHFLLQEMLIAFPTYLTITLNRASSELSPIRPLRHLVSLPVVISTVVNSLCNLLTVVCAYLLVQRQPWYSNTDVFSACISENESMSALRNGTRREASFGQSFETTSLWVITSFGGMIIAFIVSKGKPFRMPLYTNYVFSFLLVAQIAVFLFLTFTNNEDIETALELVCTPTYWRTSLILMLFVSFIAAYTVETYIVDNRGFWNFMKTLFKYKSKSKYRILQRSLEKDPNWPPLNVTQLSEPISADIESKIGLLELSV